MSRNRAFFVIARNSSFTYKGKPVDTKQVARELGVRYVLEGSVRKSGNRVRVTGQFIEAETGRHLWADRFDGDMVDIFDLQDQLVTSVVGAIAPQLEKAEIDRAKLEMTSDLAAYDFYLRGLASWNRWTAEENAKALQLFNAAIAKDPDFSTPVRSGGFVSPFRQGERLGLDLRRRRRSPGWSSALPTLAPMTRSRCVGRDTSTHTSFATSTAHCCSSIGPSIWM